LIRTIQELATPEGIGELLALPPAEAFDRIAAADGSHAARQHLNREYRRARDEQERAYQRQTRDPGQVGGPGAALREILGPLRELPPGVGAPPGYRVGPFGVDVEVFRQGEPASYAPICAAPLLLCGRLGTAEDPWLVLGYAYGGSWIYRAVPRSVALDSRQILGVPGLPVGSDNAAKVVEYLRLSEVNPVPSAKITHHLGWYTCSATEAEWIDPAAAIGADPAKWPADRKGIKLESPPGMARFADSLRQSGTFEAWLESVNAAPDRIRIAAVAALAAPLVRIVGADPFVVEWAARSTTGKTGALRVAASVWGKPEVDSLISGWNSTPAALEDIFGYLSDLPVMLDETSLIPPKERLKAVQLVYQFTQGRGKDRRLPKAGLQGTATWRGILLSTGESPIAELSTEHGTSGHYARILSFAGPPWGIGEEAGRMARDSRAALLAHYGHAGPLWIRYLLQRHAGGHLDELKGTFEDRKAEMIELLPGAAQRLADPLALLEIVSERAQMVLGLKKIDVLALLPKGGAQAVADAIDAGERARALVVSWLHSSPAFLAPRGAAAQFSWQKSGAKPDGWYAVDVGEGWYAIPLAKWDSLCNKLRISPGIWQDWRDRGWLRLTRDGRDTQVCPSAVCGYRPTVRIFRAINPEDLAQAQADREALEPVNPPNYQDEP